MDAARCRQIRLCRDGCTGQCHRNHQFVDHLVCPGNIGSIGCLLIDVINWPGSGRNNLRLRKWSPRSISSGSALVHFPLELTIGNRPPHRYRGSGPKRRPRVSARRRKLRPAAIETLLGSVRLASCAWRFACDAREESAATSPASRAALVPWETTGRAAGARAARIGYLHDPDRLESRHPARQTAAHGGLP
jgi:hypothetical protein